MNGVFQPVTVIDTIIFWKVKDLLMWQTTVWETLKLHNSHCFQLNAWHDRLALLKRGGGEENSSNLCRRKHYIRYRETGEIRGKKTWLAPKTPVAGGWAALSCDGRSWCRPAAEQGLGWALGRPCWKGCCHRPSRPRNHSAQQCDSWFIPAYSPNKCETAV